METKTIKYSITFLSDWHAGSGLGSGANADAVVIKDKQNFPFLPGKTIKGLLRDALQDILDVQSEKVNIELMNQLFGFIKADESTEPGQLFFSNAELDEDEKKEISSDMTPFLYRNLASTTIGDNGVAKEGSLRTMEVCVPLELHGQILNKKDFSPEELALLDKAMKWTRALGSNRNRGLGRCKIQIKD
jgi:CRISPR/Cas system CSM-associated protein Csm3 (group 7 of RAMP superfamily)